MFIYKTDSLDINLIWFSEHELKFKKQKDKVFAIVQIIDLQVLSLPFSPINKMNVKNTP